MPAASHSAEYGATSRAMYARTVSRNCSCSGSKIVRRMIAFQDWEMGLKPTLAP